MTDKKAKLIEEATKKIQENMYLDLMDIGVPGDIAWKMAFEDPLELGD